MALVNIDPWDELAAAHVLGCLDPADHLEAELARGTSIPGVALYAEWRAMEPHRVLSHVLTTGSGLLRRPFAVLGLVNTGQAGVAGAAFLARDHARNRYALARAGRLIRAGMPEFATRHGINRIEARCWAGHPTAARFLTSVGFRLEATCPGFGASGTATFLQFAWINPELLKGETPPCAS